jgi:hypothetical protein
MATDEQIVIMFGNCQMHYLAGILTSQGIGQAFVVGQPFGFYPENRGNRAIFISGHQIKPLVTSAKKIGQRVVFIEQISPLSDGISEELLRLSEVHILVPYVEIQSYWPHLSKSTESLLPSRIARRLDFDIAAIRRSENKSGLDHSLSDFIVANHTTQNLMNTFNHPGGRIMLKIHSSICEVLQQNAKIDQGMFERAQGDILRDNGISFMMDHPIRPEVIQALKLEWPSEPWYSSWVMAIEASRVGDMAQAKLLLKLALTDPICDPHVNYSLGLVCAALGENIAALNAFAKLHRAYPTNLVYAQSWASAHKILDKEFDDKIFAPVFAGYPTS